MNVIVAAHRTEPIEITRVGDAEPNVVEGPSYVEFRFADGQRFEVEWTYRAGPMPALGSKWRFVEEA